MRRFGSWCLILACLLGAPTGRAAEWNPVRREPIAIGPQAERIIVGFKASVANAQSVVINARVHAQSVRIVEARTSPADVSALAQRTGIALAHSRQLTPDMHVLFLPKRLYGEAVLELLAKLRADPAVAFAAVDHRRYALAANSPDDPLFAASATPTLCTVADGCSPAQSYYGGQWYMRAPPVVANSTDDDLAATDAVDAWGITTGSSGVVIADVDTGVIFEHPDLGRAGFGGRLLPGYDFVGQDFDPVNGNSLGTYKVANDGDGWDPDPSDPGDWVDSTDFAYKDVYGNNLFPQASCGQPRATSGSYLPVDSSWHGTRVSGILGALTNNAVGIAGMTWGPYLLPVRALGKCGGYDSDIIAGIEWAAGMPVTDSAGNAVPSNPYPASIINLSLGGSPTAAGACPSSYQSVLQQITQMGVLVVASAGNGGAPGTPDTVDAPAVCSSIPGVVAVAGLRNVGTKVGYSSNGPEVTISAPAGNCVQLSGACLRTLDTTTNGGTTSPNLTQNTYTNQMNPNLGTSFSAPIVAGIAALMRSVNANLTPAQLSARLASSATPFPANTGNLPVCPQADQTTGECSCPPSGQCGAGMVNALAAVDAALRPIAAVKMPTTVATGQNASFDASGSAAACGRTIATYAWQVSGGVQLASSANAAQVSVIPGTTAGTLTLTVTDSAGQTDVATIQVPANGAPTAPPDVLPTAGSAATACPTPLAFSAAAPTIGAAFSPSSVGENVTSTLTITFTNANPFALTEVAFNYTLPNNLTIPATPQTTTNCTGGQLSASYSTTNIAITGAVIPVNGSCSVVVPVVSSQAGSYALNLGAGVLSTGPAGGNMTPAAASLTVTSPGGGGEVGWPDLLVGAVILVVSRRRPTARRARDE